MKAILILVGAIAGVLLVRQFILEGMEILAWEIFWSELPKGDSFPLTDILSSTTFWKCITGAVVGGVIGTLVSNKIMSNQESENS